MIFCSAPNSHIFVFRRGYLVDIYGRFRLRLPRWTLLFLKECGGFPEVFVRFQQMSENSRENLILIVTFHPAIWEGDSFRCFEPVIFFRRL